jgi:hypothetical protein
LSNGSRLAPSRFFGGVRRCHLRERGVEVEQLDEPWARLSLGDAGPGEHERHAGAAFVEVLLEPESVLAGEVAVVAPEHHDRVVAQAQPVERVEDAAELRVHERDRGVVARLASRVLASSMPKLGHGEVLASASAGTLFA